MSDSLTHGLLPADDVDATLVRIDGVRGRRYAEIILIGADRAGRPVGSVYNTTAATQPASWPQLFAAIDPDRLAEEHHVRGAIKSGPRTWCLDWLEARTGAERDFAGVAACWVASLDVVAQPPRPTPYRPLTTRRDTRFGIDAGSPAFVLDDPEARTWVLKSADATPADLTGLGDRLYLPPGWTCRDLVLDADLVLVPDDGTAQIMQDDIGNVYDRAGGPFSNYRP